MSRYTRSYIGALCMGALCLLFMLGMERPSEEKKSHGSQTAFAEQLEEAVSQDTVLTEGAFKKLGAEFEKLPLHERKRLAALQKKLYNKRLHMVTYQRDFMRRLSVIGSATLKAALGSGVLYILPILAGNQEFSEAQLRQEFAKGMLAGALDALGRQLIGGGTQLVVTPVGAASVGVARAKCLAHMQHMFDVKLFPPEALSMPLVAVKSAAVEAVFQFVAREGGLVSLLTSDELVGALQPEFQESKESSAAVLQQKNAVFLLERLQAVLPGLLKHNDVLKVLHTIMGSALQGTAIYILLSSLGIEPQDIDVDYYARVGAFQGILNSLFYRRSYGALVSPGTFYASALLAAPVTEQGLTGLMPAGAGVLSNIALNQVLGKKGGVGPLLLEFMSKTQFLPQLPRRWWQTWCSRATNFIREMDISEPYDVFQEAGRNF